jgi:hypothetical protein
MANFLYYNVRVKGHYAENWTTLYSPAVVPLNPSNSDYTVLSFPLTLSPPLLEQGYSLEFYETTIDSYSAVLNGLPANSQIDFQVEAMMGYLSRTTEFASWHFTGEESDWSNTQTITIGTNAPLPSQNPDQSNTQITSQTELQAIIALLIAIIALLIITIRLVLTKRR